MIFKVQRKNNALHKVCMVALLLGLPLSTRKRSKRKSKLVSIWITVISILKTCAFFSSSYYIYMILPTFPVGLTMYSSMLVGFGTSAVIMVKRKRISFCLQKICLMFQAMKPGSSIGNKNINFHLMIFLTVMIVFSSFMGYFFFYQEWYTYRHRLELHLSEIPEIYRTPISSAVFLSIIFAFCISGAIGGMAELLCDSTYITLSQIIKAFGENLKANFRIRKVAHGSWLSDETELFGNICRLVKSTDESLNICTLFLYGMFISLFYISVSVGISTEESLSSTIVKGYVGWNCILSFMMFRRITLSGSLVKYEGDALKSVAAECSEILIRDCVGGESLHKFSILLGNIREASLSVTGGNMFTIEKSLFLTVVGTMVTYGIIIFQASPNF